MYEYVIRLRVTDFLYKYLSPQHILVHVMSLVNRGLRTPHYMDLPSAARRLKANFSGVIAFDFSIDVVAHIFWESRNKKTYRNLVSCSNVNK